jgi:2-keto-4-pentenoate hydratase/2-oxohepta-3-ene-1,7-dioic acid hydratase in catechol pathway
MTSSLIARYAKDDHIYYGQLQGDRLLRLTGSLFGSMTRTGEVDSLSEVKLLTPIESPRIFGLAYNYNAHTQEANKQVPQAPVVFMKPSTAVIGPEDAIVYPRDGEIVHYEGELTVIIGKRGRHIPEDKALEHVLGYTCGNDISDRVVQRRESAFGCLLAGKGYDTFAPIGPVIATGLDPSGLRVITRVNGKVHQDGNTADLLFSVPYAIAYLSRFMTLLPGDVIMTGTPAGVGPITPGDVIEVEIPQIGVLRNSVVAET